MVARLNERILNKDRLALITSQYMVSYYVMVQIRTKVVTLKYIFLWVQDYLALPNNSFYFPELWSFVVTHNMR